MPQGTRNFVKLTSRVIEKCSILEKKELLFTDEFNSTGQNLTILKSIHSFSLGNITTNTNKSTPNILRTQTDANCNKALLSYLPVIR